MNKKLIFNKKLIVIGILIIYLFSFMNLAYAKDDINIEKIKDKPKLVEDEIIVKFNKNYDNKKLGVTEEKEIKENIKVLKVPKFKTQKDLLDQYKNLDEVEYAEYNYYCYSLTNDEYYYRQWNFETVNNDNFIYTGKNVIIAVIDTGISITTDFNETSFIQGYDFVNNDLFPTDDNGHGTHVAGTIAQSTNNGLGCSGIAYNSVLMAVKVLDENGGGTYSDVAEGIYYAVDNGAKIISLSLGGTSSSLTLEEAVKYAYNHNVVIVCAGGNEGDQGNEPIYPAAYDNYVIGVGAVRYDLTRSFYSNTGYYIDVVACGGDMNVDQNNDGYPDGILQQIPDNSFVYKQGTSMATPHVTALCSLLIEKGYTNNNEIMNRIFTTCDDLGIEGFDNEYGYGLINISRALSDYNPENPLTTPSPIPSQTPINNNPELIALEESDFDILDYGLVMFVVLGSTFMVYRIFNNQYGLLLGMILGIVISISAELLSQWVLIILVIILVALFMFKKADSGSDV